MAKSTEIWCKEPILVVDSENGTHFCRNSTFCAHCLIYASKNPKSLETNLNYDLKNLTQWLYSHRLSLNIDKTKLLIFHSKYNKKNYDNIIIKLQGVRLEHSNSVKSLGVYIDHNISWDLHFLLFKRKA